MLGWINMFGFTFSVHLKFVVSVLNISRIPETQGCFKSFNHLKSWFWDASPLNNYFLCRIGALSAWRQWVLINMLAGVEILAFTWLLGSLYLIFGLFIRAPCSVWISGQILLECYSGWQREWLSIFSEIYQALTVYGTHKSVSKGFFYFVILLFDSLLSNECPTIVYPRLSFVASVLRKFYNPCRHIVCTIGTKSSSNLKRQEFRTL